MRPGLLAVLTVSLVALAGCRSMPASESSRDTSVPQVAYQSGPVAPGVVDYVMVVPENLAYVPWKMVAGLGKGMVDGGSAGFEPQRLPILGVLFLPVNVAVGGVTGLVAGTLSEPGFVGPSENFSRTMGLPLQRRTPVWWLP